jgi:hypothetical protein
VRSLDELRVPSRQQSCRPTERSLWCLIPQGPRPRRPLALHSPLDSNRSRSGIEPGLCPRRQFLPGKDLGRPQTGPGFSDAVAYLADRESFAPPRQRPGKLKTIPTAPGNRNCAGARGGTGRTRTCEHAVISRRAAGIARPPHIPRERKPAIKLSTRVKTSPSQITAARSQTTPVLGRELATPNENL